MALEAWGKTRPDGAWHHLAHHCADVAAVFIWLLKNKTLRERAETALEMPLSQTDCECLAALTFLHDIGKIAPSFQAKAWPEDKLELYKIQPLGHLQCGIHWLNKDRADALNDNIQHFARWPDILDWLTAAFAHHGKPVTEPPAGQGVKAFPNLPFYDWIEQERTLGKALRDWFPAITRSTPPKPTPAFIHFFCGLVNLADWIGSDERAFPYEPVFRADYWETALIRAQSRIDAIGLGPSLKLAAPAQWSLISDHTTPRPAQQATGALPVDEQLVLLEAETGAGKTEAALWRFITLLEAGQVEALYFAVPTRAAASQLHRRITIALARMFELPPEAVLAIPGQARAGHAKAIRLPDFSTLWSDDKQKPNRWAAEHAARYLAAQIAVGTVDQIALGGLRVKYAHLRGSCLSRALLVIDEVHASDPYMTAVQSNIVRSHLDLGGHVFLMSATLGSVARRKWREETILHDFETEAARPYPALWTSKGVQAIPSQKGCAKTVEISAHFDWSAEHASQLAIRAAKEGARVLVIRNTVQRAQETFTACHALAPELLLHANGIPSLHHSRFAAEDRALLDRAVEQQIGKDSPMGGRIVIGTQTLEQSLDLCADLLITDLCPMDVLLQRIGRLHRHQRPRPKGYEVARAFVLSPQHGLAALTKTPENGLGARENGPSLSGVYVDISGLAATLQEIERHPQWFIPSMNRALVEACTHPEPLAAIAQAQGWQTYHQRVMGKAYAEMSAANLVLLDRNAPLKVFPSDEAIRTRLGESGAFFPLPEGTIGAFGAPISSISLPAHWSKGLNIDDDIRVEMGKPTTFHLSDRHFNYDACGLSQGAKNAV